nr:AEC family transporter [uncultured Mediterraneibacter sp.]
MSILTILQQMAVIALLAAIGFYFYRIGKLGTEISTTLSSYVVDICNPALSLSCILQNDITTTHKELLLAVFIAACIYFFLIFIGILISKLLRIPSVDQKYYQMMSVYTNTGFIGIPLAQLLLPSASMIYVIIYNVMYNLFFYTHGLWIMKPKEKRKEKSSQNSSPLNLGLIGGLFTLIVCWFHLTLPSLLKTTIIYIGNANTFLSMILLGASIAAVPAAQILKGGKLYGYLFLRQLCIPVLLSFLLKLLTFDTALIYGFVLLSAMPAANMPLMLAERNHEPTEILSQGILLTTVFSLITVPVILSFI